MNQNTDIDQAIHTRLYNAEAPPPTEVWERIADELRRRKRRRFFVLVSSVLFAGVAATGLWIWFSQTGADGNDPMHTKPALPYSKPALKQEQYDEPYHLPVEPQPKGAENQLYPELDRSIHDQAVRERPDNTPNPIRGGRQANSPVLPPAFATVAAEQEQVTDYPETPELPVQPLDPLALAQPELATPPPAVGSRVRPVRHKQPTNYCYPFQEKSPIWMVDGYLGPTLVKKELSAISPDDQEFLQDRMDTEKQDWGFHAGLRATVVLGRHFLLRGGLHYEQFVEQFEYINPNSISVITRETTTWVNGEAITVKDTLDILYGDDYTRTYNRFGLLDIPVEAGLELRGRRSGLSIQGGISMNVLFWQNGRMLSTNGEPVAIGDDNPAAFRDRVGLSAGGSVQWFYHLKPKTRLFVEPYYRKVLKPVSSTGYPLEQRYGFGGVRLGVTRVLY